MTASIKPIDTDRFAAQLRARAIDLKGGRVLVSRLAGSGQEADRERAPITATCSGQLDIALKRSRRTHFRWKQML